jgi:DNA-binding CsgD family transcriptional regulator
MNKITIEINGKNYKSISECCRDLDIDRKKVYNKIKQNKLDCKNITHIQNCIKEILNKTPN